jgi:hypothetical protein
MKKVDITYKTFENKVIDLFRENGKLVSKIIVDMKKGEYIIVFKQMNKEEK